MGLALAPQIFTKQLKPVFATIRKHGHANVANIDDSLLISKTELECQRNVEQTTHLMDIHGLTINDDKSILNRQDVLSINYLIIYN